MRQNIFISYSHRDQHWLERLTVHLHPLVGENTALDIWDDRRIRPGSAWRAEIEAALSRARVAILVISADFLASDFINQVELPALFKAASDDGTVLLPLIVSPSRFSATPILGDLQALNDLGRPLITLQQAEQEAVLARATETIEGLLQPGADQRTVRRLTDVQRAVDNAGAGRSPGSKGAIDLTRSFIAVDVSLHSDSSGDNPFGSPSSDFEVSYSESYLNGELSIDPRVGYLDHFAGHGAIRAADYWHCPWERGFKLPSLDIKIVNNSGSTALFTKAVIDLEKSTPIDIPTPIIRVDKLGNWARELIIINDGWGDLPTVTAHFNISPSESTYPDDLPESEDVGPPYKFQVTEHLRPEKNELLLDFSDALARSGADIRKLKKLGRVSWEVGEDYKAPRNVRAALGPFRHNLALLTGELRYEAPTVPAGVQSVRFIATTWLVDAGRKGAPRPPSAAYSVLIPPEGGQRSIPTSISQEVKTGDTDRFTLQIASRRSSRHRFRVRLIYNDNQAILSPWIALEVFMPRSALKFLEAKDRG